MAHSAGWRRIHDLSFPYGKSVNDGIQEEYGSLIYQTFDDAVRLVQKHGPRCKLRKRDLKDAFRKIPISPLDYWLFVFEWEGTLYVDVFLPFGLRMHRSSSTCLGRVYIGYSNHLVAI
jgi:hypothetical protein